MAVSIFFFLLGLTLLIKGADFLVDGASSFAKRLHIPDIVIGLTIVSFGTSAPELIVNIVSALRGTTDIAIGNILGSNIANIFLILGISAIVYPLAVQKNTTWKEIPLSLLAAVVVGVLGNDMLIDGAAHAQLTRIDGFIFLFFFILFMYYIVGIARTGVAEEGHVKIFSIPKSLLWIGGGLAALTIGGKLTVDAAVTFARALGVSEMLIGLTIVAIGTSLPELATSVVAAMKRNVDIAVGNIVGSNIFNIFWILGVTALIRPLPLLPTQNIDIAMTVLASLFLFLAMFIGKRRLLERWQGVAFVTIYIGYVIYLIQRG
ncbi:calcium/sodium antiporter [Candidatus Uhrbacteria bacterium]|nr:calcium/sodium antiporter [Candidatus Uhrbacteria bacterium]